MDAVSGIFLSALGTDMTAMEEYFPFLSKAFDVMQYTAWGYAVFNNSVAVVQGIWRTNNGK